MTPYDTYQKLVSLPAWAAWIETCGPLRRSGGIWSLPAWAAWIETIERRPGSDPEWRRCPRGQRGLKQERHGNPAGVPLSLPAWAAWIETKSTPACRAATSSLPARVAAGAFEGSSPLFRHIGSQPSPWCPPLRTASGAKHAETNLAKIIVCRVTSPRDPVEGCKGRL